MDNYVDEARNEGGGTLDPQYLLINGPGKQQQNLTSVIYSSANFIITRYIAQVACKVI